MDDERFDCVDRWLTKTLRYDSTMLLSLDELQRRARKRRYGKAELLYVAFTARKTIRRGPSLYRVRGWVCYRPPTVPGAAATRMP